MRRVLVPSVAISRKSLVALSFDTNQQRVELKPESSSVQIASVVLEGSHPNPITQPLDLQLLEVVVLVVLDDDLLQLTDFALHPGTQLSLHLQQCLGGKGGKGNRKSFNCSNDNWCFLVYKLCTCHLSVVFMTAVQQQVYKLFKEYSGPENQCHIFSFDMLHIMQKKSCEREKTPVWLNSKNLFNLINPQSALCWTT